MQLQQGDFWIHSPYHLKLQLLHIGEEEFCRVFLMKEFPLDEEKINTFIKISYHFAIFSLFSIQNMQYLYDEVPFLRPRFKPLDIYNTCVVWGNVFGWSEIDSFLKEEFPVEYQKSLIQVKNSTKTTSSSRQAPTLLSMTPYTQKRWGKKVSQHTMIFIPPGSFQMGNDDRHLETESQPVQRIHITTPFWCAAYPVAQLLYKEVMGVNPSTHRHDYLPVENISWCEAIWFCNELSRIEGLEQTYSCPEKFENSRYFAAAVRYNPQANGYRLLTEAEWEYCAKAGTNYIYSGSDNLNDVGWFAQNSRQRTHYVGDKAPNGWGLYDLSGNVSDWVWDCSIRYYTSNPAIDPIFDTENHGRRMYRGGNYAAPQYECSVSYRRYCGADQKESYIGFRIARGC